MKAKLERTTIVLQRQSRKSSYISYGDFRVPTVKNKTKTRSPHDESGDKAAETKQRRQEDRDDGLVQPGPLDAAREPGVQRRLVNPQIGKGLKPAMPAVVTFDLSAIPRYGRARDFILGIARGAH